MTFSNVDEVYKVLDDFNNDNINIEDLLTKI